MNANAPVSGGRRTVVRGMMTGVFVLVVTAAAALAVWMSNSNHARFDLTATRDHALSARTRNLLASLEDEHEIIIVANSGALDARARVRIADVLEEFGRTSSKIRVSSLDATSPADRAAIAGVIDRVASLRVDELSVYGGAIDDALVAMERLDAGLPRLADAMLAGAGEGGERSEALVRASAVVRGWRRDLEQHRVTVRGALEQRLAGSSLPPMDAARSLLLGRLGPMVVELTGLAETLGAAGLETMKPAAAFAGSLRDVVATAVAGLDRLGPIEALLIARALEAGPVALVVSPTGATAIEFSALFPAAVAIDLAGGSQADIRFRGEELFATAIGALSSNVPPIVVLVHGHTQRLFTEAGEPATAEMEALFGALVRRMQLMGMSLTEWAVALDAERPGLGGIDPEQERPAVWVTLGLASSTAEGALHVHALAGAIGGLIGSGESVLVSIEPSSYPAAGEADPIAETLTVLGLRVDSGRPLLRRNSTPSGPIVTPSWPILPMGGGHQIAGAVRGLRTMLPWATGVVIEKVEGVRAEAIIVEHDDAEVWGEAEWVGFRSLTEGQRFSLRDPPVPNSEWDSVDGPWVLAAAAERGEQRVVVVGSNGWFADGFTQASSVIEGRTSPTYPGNGDLFEASLFWLAGQDELIAPGPRSRTIATIGAIEPARLSLLRWMIVLGPPMGTVLVGFGLRILRP